MNMLNVDGRVLGCLSSDEQKLFNSVEKYSLEKMFDEGWSKNNNETGRLSKAFAYRLKIKEGDFYTFSRGGYTETRKVTKDSTLIKFEVIKHLDGENCTSRSTNRDLFDLFRPATQEEVNSVKPQEKFVDVEITKWNKFGEAMFKMKAGYVVSGYRMNGYSDNSWQSDTPTTFKNNHTEIDQRATHVRFVKIGESC